MKYSKKELEAMAQGVFASDNIDVTYAKEDGTFLNPDQYAKLSDEEKEEFVEFTLTTGPSTEESGTEKVSKSKKKGK